MDPKRFESIVYKGSYLEGTDCINEFITFSMFQLSQPVSFEVVIRIPHASIDLFMRQVKKRKGEFCIAFSSLEISGISYFVTFPECSLTNM